MMSAVLAPAALLPPSRFKVQRFTVSRHDQETMRPLEQTLASLAAMPIAARAFAINRVEHRADDINFNAQNGFWFFNVVKKRTGHGPGKYAANQALQGFAFGHGESFGEDVAAMYVPETRDLYIQYNHVGVRHTGLATYLSKAAGSEPYYQILPKLRLDAERRLQDQAVTRKLELGFDLTRMTSTDRENGNSLTQMAELGASLDADRLYVTMTISAKDPRRRLDHRVKNALLALLGNDGLTKARVVGGDEPEVVTIQGRNGVAKEVVSKPVFEPIDLIDGLLETEYEVPLNAEYRMPLQDRYNRLLDARLKLR